MAILRDIHGAGATIILITHEEDVAAYSQRVVTLRDGEIIGRGAVMKFGSTVAQSFRSIFGNPVRSGLTVLGIVIGIAAVIAMVGLGKGLQQSVAGSLSSLNAKQITVNSQDPTRPVSERSGASVGSGRRRWWRPACGGGRRRVQAEPVPHLRPAPAHPPVRAARAAPATLALAAGDSTSPPPPRP